MPTTDHGIRYPVLSDTANVPRDIGYAAADVNAIVTQYESASATYSPTWTGSGSNPTLYTFIGRYKRLGTAGKNIDGAAKLSISGTTTGGTGTYALSLPVAAHVDQGEVGTVSAFVSGQWHTGRLINGGSGVANVIWNNGAATAPVWSAGSPFTTGNGDVYHFRFSYEAA